MEYNEPRPLLFVKDNCPRCERLKVLLGDKLSNVQVVNTSTSDGLAEAAMYEVIYKELPLLITFSEGDSYIDTAITGIVDSVITHDALCHSNCVIK